MMNVQGINCQPIKPVQQNLSFKSKHMDDNEFNANLYALEQEREEWKAISKNKDSKMLSAIGTLGVSLIAGALSFGTFKTVAPKGFNTLKSMYNQVAGLGIVKKAVSLVKKGVSAVSDKIVKAYKGIKPKSSLGKVKKFLNKNYKATKKTINPYIKSFNGKVKNFAKNHNINKEWFKATATNAGATAVAIPAAVTAANADLSEGEE